jgi:orotate phosphoribosyltransferase
MSEKPSLFQTGNFTLASGAKSNFKLECDALTDDDWQTLAMLIARNVGQFSEVIGVPRGGCELARALEKYLQDDGPRLIVDDVLTTGGSLAKYMTNPTDLGFVVFARGPLPLRVRAVMNVMI